MHCSSQNTRGSGSCWQAVILVFVIAFCAVSCSANRTAEIQVSETVENLAQFDTVLNKLFPKIESKFAKGRPVYLISDSEGPASQRYLENRFYGYLSGRGTELYQAGPQFLDDLPKNDNNGLAVRLDVQEMKVDYSRMQNNKKSKKLSRKIEVQVFCKVLDCSSGRVLVAESFSDGSEDSISAADISRLERKELPFTVAPFEEKRSRLKEFLEVGTVLSAAGIIIYLFFSTRS